MSKQPIKIWDRSQIITKDMFNSVYLVHNGKTFQRVEINDNKYIGYKFGCFATTRKMKRPMKVTATKRAKQ